MSNRTRVVITGRGIVSPLGNSIAAYWDNLVNGRSGIREITLFDASAMPTRIGGQIENWDPSQWMDKKEARRMSRASQLALAAASEAISDAGLKEQDIDEDASVLLGTGYGGIDRFEEAAQQVNSDRGWKAIQPFTLSAALPNIPGYHIAHRYNMRGHLGAVAAACASATQAIGEAAELIRRGRSNLVVTGGVEAPLIEVCLAGFCAMRGMSGKNDDPHGAIRPFDKNRDGFLMAEGAGIFVLESLEHALERGAHIYAEIAGAASTNDSYHIAQPDPEGRGSIRAMKLAMKDAGISPDAINYINPHGPGTPIGDVVEIHAMKSAFGETIYDIPISSTKSMVGHAMGAAGALEGVATLLTIENQMLHPTINCDDPEDADLDFVPVARPHQVNYAMSNNFGLGGQNASLILGRYTNGTH